MSEEQHESSTFIDEQTDTDDSMSSDGLEIDISESPNKCKKEINIEDKRVLDNIEEEIERQYDEKAAKSNLTAVNVKNILRNVITNEHVWAMVKNSTGESVPDDEHAVYEPKLTRAKAKELLKNNNVPPSAIPWVSSPGPKSEVHILINQELPEDSDDDEYVPHEEESEDEKESFHPSDADSQPATPATPTSTHDNSTQTIWTEDGNFKVPQTTSVPKTPTHDKPEETVENIALRTRSKLSLSDTPLEIIEEAFIPPDITTDMYDLECDDEDWKDFLKKFTRPLDEAVTGAHEDDDEADPEYNVLSDEEIDKLDKEEKEEEFRQDKRVKITKKELNTLVAELFEFSEIFSNEFEDQQQITENAENNSQENFTADQSYTDETFTQNSSQVFSPAPETSVNYSNLEQTETEQKPQMTLDQLMLFEQQMRQHVQMLTQNYVLSYKHVFYDNLSKKFKDMLLSLDELSKYKLRTAFRAHNLSQSVDFIKEWDAMIATNSKEVQEMLCYVSKVANEFKRYDEKNAEYVVTFPPLLMKKIAESPAFIYPSLLPKIPLRYSSREIKKGIYVKGENELIAIGLEQFRDYLKDNVLFRTRNGLLSNVDICNYICEYMMPHRDPKKLHWYVQRMRYLKEPNPINYYFANNKAPVAMHYVCSLEQYGVLPPCMRPADSLPYQWKNFLYPPDQKSEKIVSTLPKQSKRVAKPPRYKKQPKRAKIKIAQPTNTQTSDNFNSTPVLIINNFRETSAPKCEVNKSPVVIIQNNYTQNDIKPTITEISPDGEFKIPLSKAIDKNGRVLLPKVEQIFIKTEDTFLSNTNNYINNFTNDTSVIDEPPPISTTEQIKKFTPDLLKVKFNSSIFQKVKDLEMLPSMPFLQTPVKEARNFNDDEMEIASEEDPLKIINSEGTKTPDKITQDHLKISGDNFKISEDNFKISEDNFKISEDNFKTSEKSIQIIDEIENVETEKDKNSDKKDDEDELNALMVASSTMQQKNRRLQPNLTKKAKQMREYNATLAMLCPEDASISDEKAKNFAQAYYDKVQERLESESPLEYQRFVEVLSEHDETRSTVSDLYDKVSSLLSPKHPDLCEEFLSFLTPEQAQQIGKLVPHFMLSNMSLFLRKLEIYYSNQPAQLRRIYNGLTELAGTSDITMDKVKSTILPLLKGNALLIDWFLQMFPQEPPTENLLTDWEQINCDEDDTDEDKKVFETLNLPEVEDPYGGPNCICKCHKIDDEMYKSRARHCIPCGTKFLQGRVYVQTGKGLRLANVTFNNSDSSNVDHINRLTVKPIIRQKRKSETSPSKIIMSPTKDDEPRHSNESEDDINTENTQRKIKTLKPFRTSSPSKPRKKPTQKVPKTKKETVKTKPTSQKKVPKVVKKKVDKKETKKTETPEGEKVESETEEMDTCEESSQDTLEESDDSLEEIVSSEDSNSPQDTTENSTTWTRDEDKTILETVQKCPENEDVYKLIRKLLPGRTEAEIKHRLQLLITLIRTKMSP